MTPTIQGSEKVELEILTGDFVGLENTSVPSLQVVHQIAIGIIFQTPKT